MWAVQQMEEKKQKDYESLVKGQKLAKKCSKG